MKELDQTSFDAEVASERMTLVDFWVPWCGYCRRLGPVIDRLEAEYGGRLQFAAVNIDAAPELAERYGIEVIPTLALMRGGEAVDFIVNPESQAAAVAWLRRHGAI